LATEYKLRLEREHANNKVIYKDQVDIKFDYDLEVKVDAKWDYPPPLHKPEEPTTQVFKHQFTGQLLSSLNALREWEKRKGKLVNTNEPDYVDVRLEEASPESSKEKGKDQEKERKMQMQISRFQKFALNPQRTLSSVDRRIKVAIIDNGADRIRSKFRHMIAKGQSYVNADLLGSDRSLPWWMVSDPHGTQIASLIGQTNDYCRLYITRVGKGRNDIQPADAAKAVDWAVEQKVDIISISWTLKQPDGKLEEAIKKAATIPTLIFCSTLDEGVYSDAWPIGYNDYVLSVSATNRYGHLTPQTAGAGPVDIQIPGENIRAAGPS
jgi:Subtilase family